MGWSMWIVFLINFFRQEFVIFFIEKEFSFWNLVRRSLGFSQTSSLLEGNWTKQQFKTDLHRGIIGI